MTIKTPSYRLLLTLMFLALLELAVVAYAAHQSRPAETTKGATLEVRDRPNAHRVDNIQPAVGGLQ